MNKPTLRAATADDTEAVLDLLRVAHKEAPCGAWCEESARTAVAECLRNGAILLSLSRGQPVGTLGMIVARMWWSSDPILQERWTFVHPQHRRAPHARTLLDAARDAAVGMGVPMVIGVLSGIRTEGKVRLFQRVFGAPAGASFLVNAE